MTSDNATVVESRDQLESILRSVPNDRLAIVVFGIDDSAITSRIGRLVEAARELGRGEVTVVGARSDQIEAPEGQSIVGRWSPTSTSIVSGGGIVASMVAAVDEKWSREIVEAATSDPADVVQIMQGLQQSPFEYLHRRIRPEYQSWMTVIALSIFGTRPQHEADDDEDERLLEVVRPVWTDDGELSILYISTLRARPSEALFRFTAPDDRGRWGWSSPTTLTAPMRLETEYREVEQEGTEEDERKFVRFCLVSDEAATEFTTYVAGPDADMVIEVVESIRTVETATDPGTLGTSADPDDDGDMASRSEVLEKAMADLDELVGLQTVKDQLTSFAKFVAVMNERRRRGSTSDDVARHFVFKGSPGTGKTSVARLVGKILYGMGLLETERVVEVLRSDLVGGFVGETAQKTTSVFNSAIGGVLFIDEAYSLSDAGGSSSQDYGKESITTLLALMETHRDEICVIVAGYPAKMEAFLDSNPGLRGRFTRVLEFQDYTPAELAEVFDRMATSQDYVLAEGVHGAVTKYFQSYSTEENFSNARAARQLFEDAQVRHANRLGTSAGATDTELNTLEIEDVVPAEVAGTIMAINRDGVDTVLGELDRLVGMASVKAEITQLTNVASVEITRKARGLGTEPVSLHSCFVGNPGTGKTTVARLLGRLYGHLGLLERGHVVEVSRADLVAGFIGQTAMKTREQIDRALGGVLFIDEAYSLTPHGVTSNDFGREVIEELLRAMENDRQHFAVVLAGYPDEMNAFLDSNPGLRSRVTRTVNFPDYSNDELAAIVNGFLAAEGFSCPTTAIDQVTRYFEGVPRGPSFGNARLARNLFEQLKRLQASRLAGIADPSNDELMRFDQAEMDEVFAATAAPHDPA